jgi:hypothetical protein
MQAKSVLLEPWYDFVLACPTEQIGRAITDIRAMGGEFDSPEAVGTTSTLRGMVPAAEVKDYAETDEASGVLHRYGCSGIDGTAYGPAFGMGADSPKKLMVAYGIYNDVERKDNDHQVILQYSPSMFEKYGQPLNQEKPHHSGPDKYEQKYFIYTGNTNWGVQNLEYDPYSENWFVAVYTGSKESFVNYPMFVCDGSIAPKLCALNGRNGEEGLLLTLSNVGEDTDKNGLRGSFFPYGSTGMASMKDGSFYFSIPYSKRQDDGTYFGSNLELYEYAPDSKELFKKD